MFAVGIGQAISSTELHSIATDPDTKHLITVKKYSLLPSILEKLTTLTCDGKFTFSVSYIYPWGNHSWYACLHNSITVLLTFSKVASMSEFILTFSFRKQNLVQTCLLWAGPQENIRYHFNMQSHVALGRPSHIVVTSLVLYIKNPYGELYLYWINLRRPAQK